MLLRPLLRTCLILGANFAAMGWAPAQAAPTPITADVAAPWQHGLSGLGFPVQLAGFSRDMLMDFGKVQADIAATYQQPATGSTATLYVFHAGLADVSIWHDRIKLAIGMGNVGQSQPAATITNLFTPALHAKDSGIRSVMPVAGKGYLASGVAIFQHNDWLVAVRLSSKSFTPAELDKVLAGFVDALALPQPALPEPARPASTKPAVPVRPAYVVSQCDSLLPSQPAKPAKTNMMESMLGAALMNVEVDKESATTDTPGTAPEKPAAGDVAANQPAPPYCVQAGAGASYGIYRNGPPEAGYVLALSDAGNVVMVQPDVTGLLFGKKKPKYSVVLSTPTERAIYAPFAGLPTVDQVIKLINETGPSASVSRPLGENKGSNINIMRP